MNPPSKGVRQTAARSVPGATVLTTLQVSAPVVVGFGLYTSRVTENHGTRERKGDLPHPTQLATVADC